MQKKHLGQSRWSGVTEEHEEKAFGSKQVVWSDRRACQKSVWVKAGGLE
jgi:hypothetical protein